MIQCSKNITVWVWMLALSALLAACGSALPSQVAPEPTVAPPTPAATDIPATEPPAGPPGAGPDHPAPFMEKVVTPEWELQVLEVVRGQAAMDLLKQASSFNDPPETGMEYLLVRVYVRYVGSQPAAHVYEKIFRSQGSAGEMYKSLSFVKVEVPKPALEADLTSGTETEGWVAFQVGTGETGMMLVFWPYVSYEDNTAVFSDATPKWYLALEQ